MKPKILVLLAVLLVGCEGDDATVFFGSPPGTNVIGSWVGFTEITTADDIGTNTGSPADRGFTFPVFFDIAPNGRFTLITSGYATSFDEESERTCSGIWTREGYTISFFPTESCRALPMTRYVVGVVAPNGITLQANSNNNRTYSPITMRVFIRLDRA
jgi:hypothetical protein